MVTGAGARQRVRGRWQALAPNTRGAAWVLVASLCFSLMALNVKILGQRLDSFEIAFFRALIGFIAILPFLVRSRGAALATKRPAMHISRGVLGAVAMFCGYYAVTHLKLADAVAISYARPLFLIVLAVLFLGEVVRLRRWSATLVGFAGVLIMMRPTGSLEFASLVALFGTFLFAVVSVMVKKLSATESPLAILFYSGAVSTVAALVPALLVWQTPTWLELGQLVLVGAFGVTAQTCMIRGLSIAEATAVVPVDYARLIFAGVFGYIVFAEIPDLQSVAGALVVVAATAYIAIREARLGKAEPKIGAQ